MRLTRTFVMWEGPVPSGCSLGRRLAVAPPASLSIEAEALSGLEPVAVSTALWPGFATDWQVPAGRRVVPAVH